MLQMANTRNCAANAENNGDNNNNDANPMLPPPPTLEQMLAMKDPEPFLVTEHAAC
jgi:hypothetical protein